MAQFKTGEVDWDSTDVQVQKGGLNGEGLFLNMKDPGDYSVRVISKPYQYYAHWVKDAEGKNRKVNCTLENCPICVDENKGPQARWLLLVLHRNPDQGNEVKILGESELFKSLAEANTRMFEELGVKKIITLSPHGFNAFKNEYPSLEGNVEVLHYTQALARMVKDGQAKFSETKAIVTYHDPCYLGRHNGEFDAPRTVLRSVPGVRLKEMAKITKNSLCCGGGGGNFFTDIIGSGGDSPSRVRIREAVDTGAEILAVACPTCAKMFEDALKDEGLEDSIEVKDIAEIALGRRQA